MTTLVSNAQNKIDTLSKSSFTKWDQLNLHFKIGFGGKSSESTPLSPLTFNECKNFINNSVPSEWPIMSNIAKGEMFIASNDIFVAIVSQSDGIPVDTIKANLANEEYILLKGNSLYMYNTQIIIPIGTLIETNNLFIWGRKFSNCSILVQKDGILVTPLKY